MTEALADHPGHAGEVDSLQELRPLHVALLQEWAGLDDAGKAARAEAFRQTASAAGRNWSGMITARSSPSGGRHFGTNARGAARRA